VGALEAKDFSLAHFMPPSHTRHESVFVPLVEEVKEKADGELTINIYPAGELGAGPQQQYSRAVEGVADLRSDCHHPSFLARSRLSSPGFAAMLMRQ
jgi:TRAP-type C4-dicarboxylate transport system substrate-binding protein